jgi:hypothetical protein
LLIKFGCYYDPKLIESVSDSSLAVKRMLEKYPFWTAVDMVKNSKQYGIAPGYIIVVLYQYKRFTEKQLDYISSVLWTSNPLGAAERCDRCLRGEYGH